MSLRIRSPRLALTLAAAFTLSACGGGGGSQGGGMLIPSAQTVRLTSSAAVDGTAYIGRQSNRVNFIRTGDIEAFDPGAGGGRGFVHFDHMSVPAGAILESAILRIHLNSARGSPALLLGPVVASHVDVGPTLNNDDATKGTVQYNIGTVTIDQAIGWKELEVTGAFQADFAASKPYTQFRLDHLGADQNNNGATDQLLFEDGDNTGSTGNVPELIIKYRMP